MKDKKNIIKDIEKRKKLLSDRKSNFCIIFPFIKKARNNAISF